MEGWRQGLTDFHERVLYEGWPEKPTQDEVVVCRLHHSSFIRTLLSMNGLDIETMTKGGVRESCCDLIELGLDLDLDLELEPAEP